MDSKPDGKWKCRACGQIWDGEQLYLSPYYTNTWTCGNVFCGGTCDRLPKSKDDKYIEAAAHISKTIHISDMAGRMVLAALLQDCIDNNED